MTRLICMLAILAPLQARAGCDEVLLSCEIKATRLLTVCLSGSDLTYSYGKQGMTPDLALTSPLNDGSYTPWNGIGRYILDSITFRNAEHSYEVWQSIDKMNPDAGPVYGLNVLQGDGLVTTQTCDAGAVAAPFDGLYDAMQARGLCWNFDTRSWRQSCP